MHFLMSELFGLGELPHLKEYKCANNDFPVCALNYGTKQS